MPEWTDDKFMLLYNEIKTVRQELTTLKDERLQRMSDDVAALKVRMYIVWGVLVLVGSILVTQYLE